MEVAEETNTWTNRMVVIHWSRKQRGIYNLCCILTNGFETDTDERQYSIVKSDEVTSYYSDSSVFVLYHCLWGMIRIEAAFQAMP
jgi:hypothetical protein